MVTRWGLSERLGPLKYSEDEGEVFLGHTVTQHKQMSDETAHVIDEEVRRVVDRNYARAKTILEDNMPRLHAMADALIQYETIDAGQIEDVMAGRAPRPPEDWDDDAPTGDGDPVGSEEERVRPPREGPIGGPASEH